MKKSLLFLVVSALLWGGAATAQAGTVSGECGAESANLTWTLDTQTGVLEISGTGAMKDYDSSGSNRAPWYNYYSSITSVTIGEGVTTIGDYAFRGCERLISVTIPEGVTAIGNGAFQSCSSLISVTIPESITSIGSRAFFDCTNLTEFKGKFASSDHRCLIGNIGEFVFLEFFAPCGLNEYTIPDGVTSIDDYAFAGCDGLTSVTIPESVTSIGNDAFSGCSGLTEVTIVSRVANIYNDAFYGCTGLKKVYISDLAAWCRIHFMGYFSNPLSYAHNLYLDNTLVTDLKIPDDVTETTPYAFYGCTSLASVTIPNSVTTIGGSAFSGCSGLTEVTIGDGVTSIGSYAFSGCTSLASVTIGNGVTSIGDSPFGGCTGLQKFDGKFASSDHRCLIVNDKLRFFAPSGLKQYTTPDGVTTIGSWAFYNCSGLTSVTIGNGVTTIDYLAFDGCSGLISLTIGEGVTTIGSRAFARCTNLWTITPLSTTPPDFPGDTFDDITYKNARVFPPKGSLNTYQGHSAWKRFNYTPVQSRLNPRVINGTAGQTTYSCTLSYTRDIDSPVSKFYILSEGKEYLVDPSKNTIPITVIDLEPQTEYKDLEFVIETVYGEKAAVSVTFTTDTVHLTTQPAKNTNAKATLEAAVECDAETGYGFEWRRYGAPDNLPPTRVEAYNIDGKISGTLRKLTPDTYYEYRPYYCTAKGKYYYGAWLSFGTFDYGVEWDPTVSTRTGEVRGNTTTLSGYIVEGSDEIISQGFEYWAESPAGSTIAVEHKRVEGSGSLMNVTLTGLDYNTIYYYRAYATTAKKTTYGTIESFTTGENPNPSGVEETAAEEGFAVRLSGNPVRNGEIGVQVVGADGATWYRVISLHGAQIAQGVLSGTDEWQPVKIPAASTGYYLLQIIGSKGTKTLRIVVE